jgi:uncharacterized protein (DUF305 family)
MKTSTLLLAITLGALPAVALAQATHGGHSGHAASAAAPAATPASKAYVAAMDKMHGPMMQAAQESDPDVAFVKGMIPHHQGAIEMAKVVLQYGKDEQAKKWASDVIREQQREIDEMQAWLKKRGQ